MPKVAFFSHVFQVALDDAFASSSINQRSYLPKSISNESFSARGSDGL